ncbi:hypothetical protein [Flammeovirga sp. SJP92]|uniref:hypothetical protein n=1 Tax=Flammeovirga sp. SJP92 TaxID=1775430 RepID=UPI000786839E|nr:hypothetical protein [Flammeovirga sp. SJP92]KXX68876.1 hypothetical protein AVL50_17090 [Flammeovirga sp. SJP92]
MDKIEKFILENRGKLDVLTPSNGCNQRFEEILNDNLEREVVRLRSDIKEHHQPSDQVWSRIEKELQDEPIHEHSIDDVIENSSFDKFDAPKGLWDKIENALDEEDQKKETPTNTKEVKLLFSRQWLSVAAILIIGVGIGWFGNSNFNTGKNTIPTQPQNEEWEQAEDYYMSLISNKKMQINALNFEDIKLLDDFNVQLKHLQKNYKALKREASESAEPEIVRKQMVINLELQIELLNKQMEIIINSTKPERNHEDKKQYNI